MATITFQVVETAQTTATKTYTLPDTQVDRIVTAYQTPANISISGTATRAQVLNYWASVLMQSTVNYVANFENQVALAAVPGPSLLTPT